MTTMRYTIIQSPESKNDLDDIVHYISVRLNNAKAAADLADSYKEKISNLATAPRLYPLSDNPKLALRGYRHFSFGNYMAFYTVAEKTKTVNIVRIFYQKQSYNETL